MSKEHILVADDDVEFHMVIKMALEENGFAGSLHMVSNGIEVMDFLRHEGKFIDSPPPDLIIMDLKMPHKDGREVLREIKAEPALRLIPVVILSSSISEEDLRLCNDFGCLFIRKPDSYAGWIKAMQRALEAEPPEMN
ncbi:MAG: response regulator [Desulfobacteraceae bacterium]|nr:MAG: response regulator [Desulfobacteraceae bacterium]